MFTAAARSASSNAFVFETSAITRAPTARCPQPPVMHQPEPAHLSIFYLPTPISSASSSRASSSRTAALSPTITSKRRARCISSCACAAACPDSLRHSHRNPTVPLSQSAPRTYIERSGAEASFLDLTRIKILCCQTGRPKCTI